VRYPECAADTAAATEIIFWNASPIHECFRGRVRRAWDATRAHFDISFAGIGFKFISLNFSAAIRE
jgi:hypothetical protein